MTVSVDTIPLDVAPDASRLTGLIFELAAQLHEERARRMALEAALVNSGVLASEGVDTAAAVPEHRKRAQDAATRAVEALLRSTFENPDPRTPLRNL